MSKSCLALVPDVSISVHSLFSFSWLWDSKNKQCLHSGAFLTMQYINGMPWRERYFPTLVITDLSVFSGNYLKQQERGVMILAHSRPWEDQRGWCDSSWNREEVNRPPLPTLTQPYAWESGRVQLPSVCLHFLWGGQAQSRSGKLWLLSSRHHGSLWGWPKPHSLLVTATHVVFSREDMTIFINWERRCPQETSLIWNT